MSLWESIQSKDPRKSTPPPIAKPTRKTITSPKTGKKYTYDWDDPTPPTDDDLDQIISAHEPDYADTTPAPVAAAKVDTTPPPISKRKSITDQAWDLGKTLGSAEWTKAKDFGKGVLDLGTKAGKSVLDITGVSDSELGRAISRSSERSEQKKAGLTDEQITEARSKKIDDSMNEWFNKIDETTHSPWKAAKASANYLDPTGTVPGYAELGEAGVSDIKEGDWSGLAGHTALGALPVVAGPLSRGAKKLFGFGAKPSIVPPVEPIPTAKTTPLPKVEPPVATTSIADKIRAERNKAAGVTAAARAKEVEPGTNAVIDFINKKNAEKALNEASLKAARIAKNKARIKARREAANPTKKDAIPPIEELPKEATPPVIEEPVVEPPVASGRKTPEQLGRPLTKFEEVARRNKDAALPQVEPVSAPEPLPGESLSEFQRRTRLSWSRAKEIVDEYDKANPYQTAPPSVPQVTPVEPPAGTGAIIPSQTAAQKLSDAFSRSPQALADYHARVAPPIEAPPIPLKEQLTAAAAERPPLPPVQSVAPALESLTTKELLKASEAVNNELLKAQVQRGVPGNPELIGRAKAIVEELKKRSAKNKAVTSPVVEPVTPPVSTPTGDATAPEKLQALFDKMRLNAESNAPVKRGRGRPRKNPITPTVEPIVEPAQALPAVDTSVVEKPTPLPEKPKLVKKPVAAKVETPVVEPVSEAPKVEKPTTTSPYVKNELSDAYDAILREERKVESPIPIGQRVVARLKEFHADTYPFSKRGTIEVAETLKSKADAARARKLAKEASVVEKVEAPKVEPVKVEPAKEKLPKVDTSVVEKPGHIYDDIEDLSYGSDEPKGLNIRRRSAAEIAGDIKREEKIAANAEKRQARLDARKAEELADELADKARAKRKGDEGFISMDLLTLGLGKKLEKFIADKPARIAARAARKASKATRKAVQDKNIEALGDWANERKANYYEHGSTDPVELKKTNREASKKLYKYLLDTGQVKPSKSPNPTAWKIEGSEAEKIKTLIRNVHSKSPAWLDSTSNLVGWTKNMYLSGGIPGTIVNAHGLNILRSDYQARGIKKAAKTFAEGLFQPSKARKLIEDHADIIPEYIKRGYEVGTEKAGTGSHYVPFESLFNKTKVTSLIPKGLKLGQKLFEDPLFKRHLPANKLRFVLDRTEELAKKGMGMDEAMKMASKDANIFYGGINKSLRNKVSQDALQTGLLAPDWQESRMLLAGKKIAAAKRAMTGNSRLEDSLYTKAMGRSAAVNAVTKAGSLLLGKKIKDYISDPGGSTNLPLGTSGTGDKKKARELEMLAGSAEEFRLPEQIALASINEDPLRAALDILSNRTSQPLQSFENARLNIDRFKNPLAGKDRYGKKIPYMKGVGNMALELSKPFQYQSMQALIELLRDRIGAEEAVVKSGEGPLRYKSLRKD